MVPKDRTQHPGVVPQPDHRCVLAIACSNGYVMTLSFPVGTPIFCSGSACVVRQ